MTQIDVDRKYKKLTHLEHILIRPERHLGSIRSAVVDTWVYNPTKDEVVTLKGFAYSPALVKQFDEIITNSVDHSKTPEGKGLTEINVIISPMTGQITVRDNGGIPVVKHGVTHEWLPEMLFGSLYAGSNFNDDDEEYNNKTGGGQNGEGASLVNVFSTWFRVSTCDGVKSYTQTWQDNMSRMDTPTISTRGAPGTTITWVPDYARLSLKGLDANNTAMLCRRTFEIAACNPKLKVTLNGKHIKIERFGHFVDYFHKGAAVDEDLNQGWLVSCIPSNGAFGHHSYVNSVPTLVGGPHVDYVADQIVNGCREYLEKKFKVELKPATIKNHMRLVISATIMNPRFDSQTKERLTTPVSQFGTSYKLSQRLLTKARDIIAVGLEAEIKALRNDEYDADVQKAVKEIAKTDVRAIEKYHPATERKDRSGCILMLTEGDSASNPILAARDNTKKIGLFPLRGKFINVHNNSLKKVLQNQEFKNFCAIMGGIRPGVPIDVSVCPYPYVEVSTDADDDGKHIRGLILAMFCKFWPDYVAQGRLRLLRTPFMRAWIGDKMFEFMEPREYDEFCEKNKGKKIKTKYLKGLGGNSTDDFRRYLENLDNYSTVVTLDDNYAQAINLGFNDKFSDDRKDWFSDICLFSTEDD